MLGSVLVSGERKFSQEGQSCSMLHAGQGQKHRKLCEDTTLWIRGSVCVCFDRGVDSGEGGGSVRLNFSEEAKAKLRKKGSEKRMYKDPEAGQYSSLL